MKKLFSFFLIFILTLFMTELAVRLFLPQFAPQPVFLKENSETGLKLGRPNFTVRQIKNTGDYDVTVNINKFGFRDSNLVNNASKDDWFVIGDSFAFGWGVSESERFSSLLADMTGLNVYNLAIPATHLVNYQTHY